MMTYMMLAFGYKYPFLFQVPHCYEMGNVGEVMRPLGTVSGKGPTFQIVRQVQYCTECQ